MQWPQHHYLPALSSQIKLPIKQMKSETEDIQFRLNLIEEVCLFEEREYYNSIYR